MGRGQWNDLEKRGQKLLKARSMADIASLLSRDEAGDSVGLGKSIGLPASATSPAFKNG